MAEKRTPPVADPSANIEKELKHIVGDMGIVKKETSGAFRGQGLPTRGLSHGMTCSSSCFTAISRWK